MSGLEALKAIGELKENGVKINTTEEYKIVEQTKTKYPEAHAEIVSIIVDEIMSDEPLIRPNIIGDLTYKNPCDGCAYQNTPGDHCQFCPKNPNHFILTGSAK